MTRTTLARAALTLIVALGACSYDTGSGGTYGAPPTAPPSDPPPTSPVVGLWTSSGSNPGLLRLSSAQLVASGTLAPATEITTSSASLATLNSIAFDARGGLWVASQEDSRLLGFPQATLVSSRSRDSKLVITSNAGSLSAPSGLAFDRQQRLWVSNAETGTLVRYDPDQLVASGAPAPAVVLSGVGHPTSIAFDVDGSLWVADTRSHRIMEFGAAKLDTSGAPVPDITLSARDSSIELPSGLAFDGAGRLWFTNTGRRTVAAFSPVQLVASGSPLPAIVLSPGSATAANPTGLAFDADGSLWVISADGLVTKYDRAALGASGAPRPVVTIRLQDRVLFWALAFWPRVPGLPIN